MAGSKYTTPSISIPSTSFNGGLNSTAGPLGVQDNESSDLLNIDFNRFGSFSKRKGYTALNTSAISGSPDFDGLHWYEYDNAGTTTRLLIAVDGAKIHKMDDLDGTWDDITGGLTVTATNHNCFANFLNEVYGTNGTDAPWKWTGSSTASAMTVPSGLTKAKYVAEYNNYLFLANVVVSAVSHPSRFYWSDIKDTGTWATTNFIEVAKNDGQEITGIKVLGDRLVVYKTRSIYNVFFTGQADIPFILPGGGKSNSPVGCIAPFSLQAVDNGHVFFSYDGLYFYDGLNSFKLSDKVNETILGFNKTKYNKIRSLNYRSKGRYMLAATSSGQSENDRVLVWDYFNNAFSLYTGIAASAMTTVFVNGTEERPYFGDFAGFGYRMDTGDSDYPLNAETAINGYYWTNWRPYGDLSNKKAIRHAYLYHGITNCTLSVGYSYDFDEGIQRSLNVDLSSGSDVYGTAVYGTGVYSKDGGDSQRIDLTGRGRVVRFKFANNTKDETFRVDGFGQYAHLETNR